MDSPEHDYRVFAHLLDEDSTLVAWRDSKPLGGSRLTATWAGGEDVLDRCGIMILEGLGSGEYLLVVGVYSPTAAERLMPSADDAQVADDRILLAAIRITGE